MPNVALSSTSTSWRPVCAGGCPYKRLYEERKCVPYKDTPEAYVLALFAKIAQQKAAKEAAEARKKQEQEQA